MKRFWLAAALLLLPHAGSSETRSWTTDAGVGPNEVVYTLQLTCPNPGFVCDLVDGYDEQDTSTVTGAGTLDLDDGADTVQFDTDGTQDVGSGPQPSYLTLSGTDLVFPNIPFAGVPEITDVLVFGLSNPAIPVTGLDLLAPGDYPFSESVTYSGTGTVFGDLEFLLGPNIVVPPAAILVSGTLRVLGDLDADGNVDFQLRDVTASFGLQGLTTIGGEPVTVDVTADMTVNLASPVGPITPMVPALGPVGLVALASLLLAAGRRASRCRQLA